MKSAHITLSGSKVRCLMTGMTIMFLVQALLSCVASAPPQQPQPSIFEALCRQRKSVSTATRRTIDVLLSKVGTEDCKLADSKLKTLTNLDLSWYQISDVQPLVGLTNLTYLYLRENPIDLKVCPVKSASICKF